MKKLDLKIYYRLLLCIGVILLLGGTLIKAENVAMMICSVGLIMTLIGIVIFFIYLIKNPKIKKTKSTKFILGFIVFIFGCLVYAILFEVYDIRVGFIGGFIFMYVFLFIFAKATGWNLFKKNKENKRDKSFINEK